MKEIQKTLSNIEKQKKKYCISFDKAVQMFQSLLFCFV